MGFSGLQRSSPASAFLTWDMDAARNPFQAILRAVSSNLKKYWIMTRIFKTLTVISFLFIIVNGEHIGGPLGFFILGQLFQTNLFAAIISILVISVLIVFIYSSIRPLPKADLFVFSIGGLILTIPIGLHISYLVKNINFVDEKPFILTLLIYLLVFGITIIKIYRQRLKTTKKIK